MNVITHATMVVAESERARDERAAELAARLVCARNSERADKPACGVCSHCQKLAHGSHPDVTFVVKRDDRTEMTADVIDSMVREAVVLPNEAARKVYVIRNADTMNLAAANKFLKLLEEPPNWVAFILLCERANGVPQTVRSRCVIISTPSREADAADNEHATALFNAIASGDPLDIAAECIRWEKLSGHDALLSALSALYVMLVNAATERPNDRARFAAAARIVQEPASLLRSRTPLSAGHVAGTLMAALTMHNA